LASQPKSRLSQIIERVLQQKFLNGDRVADVAEFLVSQPKLPYPRFSQLLLHQEIADS